MFSKLGTAIDTLLNGYAATAAAAIMTMMAAPLVVGATIWVLLQGYAILMGHQQGDVAAFVWKSFRIILIAGFVAAAGTYTTDIIPFANGLATDMAATLIPNNPGNTNPLNGTDASVWTAIDGVQTSLNAFEQSVYAATGATGWMGSLDLLFSYLVVAVAVFLVQLVAVFVVIVAKLALAFYLAIGPVFIAMAMFDTTKRLFDSWVSCVLSSVVLMWVAFFVLGLAIYFAQNMLQSTAGTSGWASATNVFAQCFGLAALLVCMALVIWQGPNLASGLTGGTAVSQGSGLLRDVRGAARMFAGSRSSQAAPPAGSARGS
jgi:type IV secretion system protein VirB6